MFKTTEKAQNTKKHLFDVAIQAFADQGFDKMTMRGLAKMAGVTPSHFYYYYPSKESLVMSYYELYQQQHEEAMGEYFTQERNFEKRLHRLFRTKVETAEPYKDMARSLFRTAADPRSPMSPFSEQSRDLRTQAMMMCKELVETSDEDFHPRLKETLPHYLWLLMLGIILFWIYDRSEGSKNTFDLVDKVVPLLVSFHKSLNSPLGLLVRGRVFGILDDFDGLFDFSETNNKGE